MGGDALPLSAGLGCSGGCETATGSPPAMVPPNMGRLLAGGATASLADGLSPKVAGVPDSAGLGGFAGGVGARCSPKGCPLLLDCPSRAAPASMLAEEPSEPARLPASCLSCFGVSSRGCGTDAAGGVVTGGGGRGSATS